MIETVIALLLVLNGNIIEHTYKSSMAECLKNKRIAERTVQPERVQFACGKDIEAEVEYIEAKGETAARTRILRVIEHGYEDGEYDAGRY